MDVSDQMLAARDAIRECGWTQGAASRPDGTICLLGALEAASRVDVDAYRHLSKFCHHNYSLSPALVNDRILTSEDEACDLLEAAAKWDGGA